MKTFEYNWATAEMVKMYLRNSRAQEARARKPCTDDEAFAGTQGVPAVDPGHVAANSNAGAGHSNVDSLDSESSSDENE